MFAPRLQSSNKYLQCTHCPSQRPPTSFRSSLFLYISPPSLLPIFGSFVWLLSSLGPIPTLPLLPSLIEFHFPLSAFPLGSYSNCRWKLLPHTCKLYIRNPVLEVLFILRLMLRSPPILAGKRNRWRCFHRTSKTRFQIFYSDASGKLVKPGLCCGYCVYGM